MNIKRLGPAASLAVAGTLSLAACGSASNSDTTSSAADGSTSSTASTDCGTGTTKASGSTAQQNAIEQAIAAYTAQCSGAKVTYNGVGSGQGITDFLGKQTDFAGSDSALNPDKGEPAKAQTACSSEAWNLPMVTGPIAVAFNIKGVDKLVLTPELIAQIFAGKITTWNDPAIAAANPGTTLPDQAISVFFRSDSSGTTDNFTNYMNTVDAANWPDKHSKEWTGKVGQGKPKNAGVGQAIAATDGGIGYVEWSYAITNNLKMAELDSGSGPVALTAESAGAAVAAATQKGTGNDLALTIDYTTKAAGAYPIILVTYEIVCSTYADAAQASNVKSFLTFMAGDEFQSSLTRVGSAPLPAEVKTKVQTAIAAIS
ncbi:MAG: phosphate ABC transporter substrate-binding protein PstS [Nostocoides sp.]